MEPLSIIVAFGIITFFLLYLANSIKVSDFFMMTVRFFLIIFSLYTLFMLGAALIDNADTCSTVLNQTSEYTNLTTNVTTIDHTYMEYCVTATTNTEVTMFKLLMRVLQLFFTFMVIYILYKSLEYLGLVAKIKSKWQRIK